MSTYNINVEDAIKVYIREGLAVFPLKPRTKEPYAKLLAERGFLYEGRGSQKPIYLGKKPTVVDLTYWSKKDCNFAIVCGRVSGNFFVIDFDDKKAVSKFDEIKRREMSLFLVMAINETLIVKTGRGLHIYLRAPDNIEVKTQKFDGVDIKGEGGYVVAPPSIHPSGATYTFVANDPQKTSIQTLSEQQYTELLQLLERHFGKNNKKSMNIKQQERKLSEKEILELFELLKSVYVPGNRELLVGLFLSGWFIKAGIERDSLKKLAGLLAEYDRDENKAPDWKTKLGRILTQIDYHYNYRAKVIGDKLKAKTGVQEILETKYDEETSLEIIRKIEEILGVASPWYDSIIEILNYEKQYYAIANLRKLTVVRARREGNKMIYLERVCVGAPTALVVFFNPLGGITKYKVIWETNTRPRPLVIGPAPIDDIIDRLRAEGLVLHNRHVRDVIPAIFEGYIRKKKAEIREDIESPGFYLVDGKIVAVQWEPKKFSIDELRDALSLLNELADWFGKVIDRFSLIIKWGLVAPFGYCYKQKGRWIPWLFLYGTSFTGKTTQGEIVLYIWNLDSSHRKAGSSIDTVPRLGYVMSSSTFPTLVNEPEAAFSNDNVIGLIKSGVESTLARGRYIRGVYTELPCLAQLIITSNRKVPKDDALIRRFIILRYTYGERIDYSKAIAFDKKVKRKLNKLAIIGYYVAKKIMNEPSLLNKDWEELATFLLEDMYKTAGMIPPSWIYEKYKIITDIYEDKREAIRSFLLQRINNECARHRIDSAFIKDRVEFLLEKNILPWAILRERSDKEILLTTAFGEEIRVAIGDIGGLKSIAELLGWEYSRNFKVRGKKIQAIRVSFEKFISFLVPQLEENEEQDKNEQPNQQSLISEIITLIRTKQTKYEKVSLDEILELFIKKYVDTIPDIGTRVIKTINKLVNDGVLTEIDRIYYRVVRG